MTATSPQPHGDRDAARISSLDTIRGAAVLAIFAMNAVDFGLGPGPYFNISAGGCTSALDWVVACTNEILVDQKFMGIFSLLFGASVALFVERARARGKNALRLSLWRNLLLLAIGAAHTALWYGDVLALYAICSPLVLLSLRFENRTVATLGIAVYCVSPMASALTQRHLAELPGSAAGALGELWSASAEPGAIADVVVLSMLLDFGARALGMMLLGVALYRSGFLSGREDPRLYRRIALAGSVVGIALSSLGLAWLVRRDFDAEIALVASIPNTLGTAPLALGYVSLLLLWDRRGRSRLLAPLRAVGRTALSNYLLQTALGVLILGAIGSRMELGRAWIQGFVFATWGFGLWASRAWLRRFRFGPVEWIWRSATYRSLQSMRRR